MIQKQNDKVVSGKERPHPDQRRPACNVRKWNRYGSSSSTIMDWCIMSLFLKGKQLTNSSTRESWLDLSTKSVKNKELPEHEKPGFCITTMLLPTQPSAWNSFWSQKKSSRCIIHLIHQTLPLVIRQTLPHVKLKGILKGTRFKGVEDIKTSMTNHLKPITKEEFSQKAWSTRMEKCIKANGEYFDNLRWLKTFMCYTKWTLYDMYLNKLLNSIVLFLFSHTSYKKIKAIMANYWHRTLQSGAPHSQKTTIL